jgi:hypothetical protein
MRKFISEYNNGRYKAGCTGGTVIVIDMETNEVIDKIKVPYCYCGTFVGDRDIFIAKSTAGYLLKYDIKAKEATRIRPSTITQDGGFAVCPWDSRFYNVEMTKKGFQITVYDVDGFKPYKIVPINGEICNVDGIEFGDQPVWYVSLSYFYKGYVKYAIAKMKDYESVEIKNIDYDVYNHIESYEYWKRCGFSDDVGSIAGMVSDIYQIPITMAEIFNQ